MESFIFPAVVAILVFVSFLLLLMRWTASDEEQRKQALIDQISSDAAYNPGASNMNLLKEQSSPLPTEGLAGLFSRLPGVSTTYDLLIKAGLDSKRLAFLLAVYGAFLFMLFIFNGLFHTLIGAALIAGGLVVFGAQRYLKWRIRQRTEKFLNLFPEATDMIVRSVRAGHPLNVAMRMISENMAEPVSGEFKRIVSEVAYGRSMTESLARLSQRIDSQDVHFFVVVLSVQQETGGSLSEVLSNLSGMLRKRKQLRLKIRALTSEGRTASYILGGLPVVEFLVLKLAAGSYMEPMFSTLAGNILLGVAIILVIAAVTVIRDMANVRI
jgi:tight adherence protein B